MADDRPAHREATPEEILNRLRKITQKVGRPIPEQILVAEKQLSEFSNSELQELVQRLSEKIGLLSVPTARFSSTEEGVAGSYSSHKNLITVSEGYKSSQTVCAIVAHELTHAWMHEQSLNFNLDIENEKMTEIVSVWIGLGLYVLNGCEYSQNLGYLDQQAIAFAFVIQTLLAGQDIPFSMMNSGASGMLESMWASRYGIFLRKITGLTGGVEEIRSDFIGEAASSFEQLELELSGALAEISVTEMKLKSLQEGCYRILQDLVDKKVDLATDPHGYFFESKQSLFGQFSATASKVNEMAYCMFQAVDAAHKFMGVPSESKSFVIHCIGCSKKLRVPNIGSDLLVKCPTCSCELNVRAKPRECLTSEKMNLFRLALSTSGTFESGFRETLAKLAFDPNASLPEENSFRSRLFRISLHRELLHNPHDTKIRNALFELSVGDASDLPQANSFQAELLDLSLNRKFPHNPHNTKLRLALFNLSVGDESKLPKQRGVVDRLLLNSMTGNSVTSTEAEILSEYLLDSAKSPSLLKRFLRTVINKFVRISNSIR